MLIRLSCCANSFKLHCYLCGVRDVM